MTSRSALSRARAKQKTPDGVLKTLIRGYIATYESRQRCQFAVRRSMDTLGRTLLFCQQRKIQPDAQMLS